MLAVPTKGQASDLMLDDNPRRQELAELVKKDGLTISESARRLTAMTVAGYPNTCPVSGK